MNERERNVKEKHLEEKRVENNHLKWMELHAVSETINKFDYNYCRYYFC